MLDRMKAPKKIDASAAAEPPVERKGSAWNSGGTWEEKDVSEWAKGELERRLKDVSASDGLLKTVVKEVKDVEGAASVVASRGTSRHLCEYSFELQYTMTRVQEAAEAAEGKAATIVCLGSLSYSDVTASKASGMVEVGGVANKYTTDPPPAEEPIVAASIEMLKLRVLQELEQFDEELKAKKV